MSKEDITRMAREAGISTDWSFDFQIRLETFAALVASAEREACAKLVDYWESRQGEHSDAIRARGQA